MSVETTDGRPLVARSEPVSALAPGTRVDRYEILSLLGAGGMGEVYRARDVDLDRPVAIKVVRADLLPRTRDNLLPEAQAMAKLSHPNVVVVYEVGTFHGQVYLAMEYVAGETLRAWLQAAPRSWRDIVRVFAAAARGLAAAHHAGIVHRDFKPENVLIGTDGRVRVADFGLAGDAPGTPAEPPPGLASMDTVRFSAAASGTPAYMSPEQHLREPLDPRSDQFAFCVALFEALYRKRPFAGGTLAELRRSVLQHEIQAPPRDSKAPAWVRAVVLRGLAHNRAERFPSMDGLIAALEADPALRRRRILLTAGLAGAAALAVYGLARPTAVTACRGGAERLAGVWDAGVKARIRARFVETGRPYAEDTFARMAATLDRYAAAWLAMHQDACEATEVRHEQSASLLDLRMQCLDRRLNGVREVAAVFAGASDPQLVDRAVQAVHRLDDLAACADAEALAGILPLPADPAGRQRVISLRARLDKTFALFLAGRIPAALALAESLVIEARVLAYPPALAEALYMTAKLEQMGGNARMAEPRLDEALEEAARARDPALEARAYGLLVYVVGWDLGRPAEALAMAPGARAAALRAGVDLKAQSTLHQGLASALIRMGRFDEANVEATLALDLAVRAEGPDSFNVATLINTRGVILRKSGRPEEALRLFEDARAGFEKALGPEHPWVAGASMNICAAQQDLARYEEALQSCQGAVAAFERALGSEHPDVGRALEKTGELALKTGHAADALALFERALRIVEKALGAENLATANSLVNASDALHVLGRDQEALPLAERSLAVREKALGPTHIDVAHSLDAVANALRGLGRLREARAAAERALAISEKANAKDEPFAEALTCLAEVALAEGKAEEALTGVDRALAIYEAKRRPGDLLLVDPLAARAEALLALRRLPDAAAVLDRAAKLDPASPRVRRAAAQVEQRLHGQLKR